MTDPDPRPVPPAAPPPPAGALDYAPPPTSIRPGILTAVGVVSIVIGALSALTGCSSAVTSVMFQFMPRVAPAPMPASAPATAPAAGVVAFNFQAMAEPITVVLGLIDAVLRLGLAILLVAAGILVLRDHRLGRKLHLAWAWAKIPVALFGGLAYWHLTSSMFAAIPATPGVPPPQSMRLGMLIGAAMQTAIACAYPVAVLIVMNTRTVRNFYATVFGASVAR